MVEPKTGVDWTEQYLKDPKADVGRPYDFNSLMHCMPNAYASWNPLDGGPDPIYQTYAHNYAHITCSHHSSPLFSLLRTRAQTK